jgi:hypothetical protein
LSLSARQLLVYIDGLPADAYTWGYDGWSVRDELAAQTLELLDVTRRQTLQVLGDKKTRAQVKREKPLQVARPESVRPKKKRSWVEFARQLARKVGD